MSRRKPALQQIVRVFGRSAQAAYERTVAMREVTFGCVVCGAQMTQLRYPGPVPAYCSGACRRERAAALNRERVRKQREKRHAARAQRAAPARATRAAALEHAPGAMPLLAPKLAPPRLPATLVERGRLQGRLDRALLYPLTVLLAPAGFGKTTAVNQWIGSHAGRRAGPRGAAARFESVAWLSLDGGDNDLLRFWRYVIAACRAFERTDHSGTAHEALELLASGGQSRFAPPMVEQALTLVLNALSEHDAERLLVLDDYHVINEPRIHETLAFLIDHLPATLHVLLVSRSAPPLPLLRWRAAGMLGELHGADLRFSSAETAALLRQALPAPLSEAAVAQLEASLEGWAAGLCLLLLTLQGRPASADAEDVIMALGTRSGPSTPHRALVEYLVTEILDAQPAPIQQFLLQTSVLSRLSGPLCDTITGSANSAERLAAVERAGLFLEALDAAGVWYRYHTLFAEAMRQEAARRLGEAELGELSRRASRWYDQQGLLAEAIEAALLAGDVQRVAVLIELGEATGMPYEPQTMLRWLGALPETVLRANPALCLNYALELRFAQQPGRLPPAVAARVDALLQMAEDSWRHLGESERIGAVWAVRAMSALEQQPLAYAVECARRGLALLPREPGDPGTHLWRGACLIYIGIDQLRAGDVEAADRSLHAAREHSYSGGEPYLAQNVDLMLGESHMIQGRLRQAELCWRRALPATGVHEDHEMAADAAIELAWLAFERNELAAAEQQARDALAHAQASRRRHQELSARARFLRAAIQEAHGQAAAALEQLNALLSELEGVSTPGVLLLLPRLRSRQQRLALDAGALDAVHAALEAQQADGSVTQQLAAQIIRGRLLLAQGQARAACRLLEQLLDVALRHRHHYSALEIRLLLAQAYAACDKEHAALEQLGQALASARGENFVRLFIGEGEPLARLLRALLPTLEDRAVRAYAQTLAHAFAARPGAAGLLDEPLTAQEQRVLRLVSAGYANAEIARELLVSINTVKGHIKNLYRKLGVHNRVQASDAARRLQEKRSQT